MDDLVRQLVKSILEHPFDHEWSVQGLGMMRTRFGGGEYRLHIWDSALKNPGVSTMHDHPWDFESLVVAGTVNNQRFVLSTEGDVYQCQTILCGEGGGLCGAPAGVRLAAQPHETYSEGETYRQVSDEIHESTPEDGTVTIIQRGLAQGADPDHAHVYWMHGDWVTAEPRPADSDEILLVTTNALGWF